MHKHNDPNTQHTVLSKQQPTIIVSLSCVVIGGAAADGLFTAVD